MRKILITGASGFIGLHLFMRLVRQNKYDVYGFVRDIERLPAYLRSKGCVGNLSDKHSLRDAMWGKDVVIHCAGYVGKDRDRLWDVNVSGTENMLLAAKEAGVKRIIYLSSVAVISGNKGMLRDNMPLKATNIYGWSKVEAEKLVWNFLGEIPEMVILRPAMVYGKGEPHLLPLLCRLIRRRIFPLIGKADNRWHLCAIENLLSAIYLAIDNKDMLGRAFIVADEEVLTTREVVKLLASSMGVATPFSIPIAVAKIIGFSPFPAAKKFVNFFSKDRVYDISNLKTVGWRQTVSPKEAIRCS